jgi:hypothetical protein
MTWLGLSVFLGFAGYMLVLILGDGIVRALLRWARR